MGKKSRDKGAGYEREVVREFARHGLRAKRNLDQPRDGGLDLITDLGLVECKRRKAIADYLLPHEARFVIVRQDRGESMAIIPLVDLLAALGELRGIKLTTPHLGPIWDPSWDGTGIDPRKV